jgi:hypothetical protein
MPFKILQVPNYIKITFDTQSGDVTGVRRGPKWKDLEYSNRIAIFKIFDKERRAIVKKKTGLSPKPMIFSNYDALN